MKKITLIFSFIFCVLFNLIQAQQTIPDLDKQNWFHQSFEKTGIHGVGTNEALAFLKSKGLKPSPITVAVIDSGVEVDHEDLQANVWVNSKEIAGNGKDDDGNGYIDDINGWDFIGGKDGKDVNQDTYEMTRIIAQYKPLFDGENEKDNIKNREKLKTEYEQIYMPAKIAYDTKMEESKGNVEMYTMLKSMYGTILDKLGTTTGTNKLTPEYLKTVEVKDEQLKMVIDEIMENKEASNMTYVEYKEYLMNDLQEAIDYFNQFIEYGGNLDFNPRNIVGDNYDNKTEKGYGNNEVEGPDALHGTHVSGIIAAVRNNGKGMDGIAGDVAKIMVVRAVPDGDERDKDVANAIRYAADNGAKIMNMSFGKGFSPEKEVVWDAIKYADKKGVLMFHAAGNDNKDIDIEPNFPTVLDDKNKKIAENWITVGANTKNTEKLKSSFSNYGKMEVDLFAPGSEIYATVTDGGYKYLQGTSMASPVAAGCAALLWSYFPTLTAKQVKEILMKSVNVSEVEVAYGEEKDEEGNPVNKKPFKELSVSGGTIDIYKAVKLAYDKYRK